MEIIREFPQNEIDYILIDANDNISKIEIENYDKVFEKSQLLNLLKN